MVSASLRMPRYRASDKGCPGRVHHALRGLALCAAMRNDLIPYTLARSADTLYQYQAVRNMSYLDGFYNKRRDVEVCTAVISQGIRGVIHFEREYSDLMAVGFSLFIVLTG